ncbi:hypothetical protein GCM10009641_87940 [Mycobacterium cookii]|uniref:Uncharacterized protein n=1 Tax=Nocardioides furvisabuli TaxID=375542 RepID=A0ABP5I8X0_9ACTN|nr:hypothetical protein [Nocardioides furvisabuli]
MNAKDPDPKFDARVDEFVRTGRMPSLEDLDEPERSETAALLDIAGLVWELGHGAPPLEADPIAATLGLVPDLTKSLDKRALKSAMLRARIDASELARRLKAREWSVETRDVFMWTSRGGPDVPPALIRAVADILGTTSDRLTSQRQATAFEVAVREVVQTPAFEALAQRWALLQRSSLVAARSALAARVPLAVNRGDHPDPKQMLASLGEVVASLEANERRD